MQIPEYCREIETYLCRKNDGHLIRVTGPSFDLVSGWAVRGVPLKIAFQGIDRYFERYYRKGPRRRPVKIDFCEADVLDAFDDWRRATGIGLESPAGQGSVEQSPVGQTSAGQAAGRRSLRAHLERVVMRLSSARAHGVLEADADDLIDRVAAELDKTRADARGLRREARRQAIERLGALDRELLAISRRTLDAATLAALEHDADSALAPFRPTMAGEAYARAKAAAIDRLVRERCRLPTIAFD